MLTDNLCCNCHYYDGVQGVPGCAHCKHQRKMVMWNDVCEDIWLIPERIADGKPTNFDKVRAMTDTELAQFIEDAACPPGEAPDKFLECIAENCPKCWLAWLRQEVKDD